MEGRKVSEAAWAQPRPAADPGGALSVPGSPSVAITAYARQPGDLASILLSPAGTRPPLSPGRCWVGFPGTAHGPWFLQGARCELQG